MHNVPVTGNGEISDFLNGYIDFVWDDFGKEIKLSKRACQLNGLGAFANRTPVLRLTISRSPLVQSTPVIAHRPDVSTPALWDSLSKSPL